MTRDEFIQECNRMGTAAVRWTLANKGKYDTEKWITIGKDARGKLLSTYDEMAEEIERTNNDMVWAATKMSDMETAMDAIHNKVDELRKENDRLMDKIDEQRAEMEAYRLICNCKAGKEINNE